MAAAVAKTVEQFGGIDVVVNNASAIDLTPTEAVSMKRYDLMQDINARGTFLLSKLAIPHLRKAANADDTGAALTAAIAKMKEAELVPAS